MKEKALPNSVNNWERSYANAPVGLCYFDEISAQERARGSRDRRGEFFPHAKPKRCYISAAEAL